jgi:NADPH-dependent curcumin reductase CurA
MEAVYARLNVRARVPRCGLISTYNDDAAVAINMLFDGQNTGKLVVKL